MGLIPVQAGETAAEAEAAVAALNAAELAGMDAGSGSSSNGSSSDDDSAQHGNVRFAVCACFPQMVMMSVQSCGTCGDMAR